MSQSSYQTAKDPVKSSTRKVVDKTVLTGKSLLSYLVEPLKTKYIKTKINSDLEIFSKGGERYVTNTYEIRQSIFFKRIFGNKGTEIKFVNNKKGHVTFPYNGVYFKRIDKYTIVICVVKDKPEDNNNYLYPVIEYKFIGLNAQKKYSKIEEFSIQHYTSLMDKYMERITDKFIRCFDNFDLKEVLRNIKSFDDIILKDDIKNEIIGLLDKYKKNEELYKKYKLKHKIGYLFYGPTGTGKSTLSYTIALYLGYSLVIVSPELIYNYNIGRCNRPLADMGDSDKRVVLIEEIDTMMDNLSVDKEGDDGGNGILRRDHILKFIDALPTNTVVIANTNYFDKLDEALIRSGRFDKKILIDNFEKSEAIKMAKYYDIEESFVDKYTFPVCPSELEFDLVQEATKRLMSIEIEEI